MQAEFFQQWQSTFSLSGDSRVINALGAGGRVRVCMLAAWNEKAIRLASTPFDHGADINLTTTEVGHLI